MGRSKRSGWTGSAAPGAWLAVVLLAAGPVAVPAQTRTLPIQEEPATQSVACDATAGTPPCSAADPEEVERLVNAATQAMILGDLAEADRYLTEALDLDPCSVEATYLKGRIVADRRDPTAASEWFCRYLALSPLGASAPEARRRLDQAVANGAGARILATFREGVARYRDGELEAAGRAFTDVLDRHPVPEALYNRALVHLATERPVEARADLERYLDLRPEGEHHGAIRDALAVPASAWTPRSAGTAFLLGAVLPGAGQYYTGRTWYGLAVTGLVAGGIAAGYFFERTTIQCRAPDPTGECPPDAIAGSETTRPLLVPALGAGAGVMLLAAIEAAIHAGGQEPPLTVATRTGALSIEIAARPAPSGALDIRLIRFRH